MSGASRRNGPGTPAVAVGIVAAMVVGAGLWLATTQGASTSTAQAAERMPIPGDSVTPRPIVFDLDAPPVPNAYGYPSEPPVEITRELPSRRLGMPDRTHSRALTAAEPPQPPMRVDAESPLIPADSVRDESVITIPAAPESGALPQPEPEVPVRVPDLPQPRREAVMAPPSSAPPRRETAVSAPPSAETRREPDRVRILPDSAREKPRRIERPRRSEQKSRDSGSEWRRRFMDEP